MLLFPPIKLSDHALYTEFTVEDLGEFDLVLLDALGVIVAGGRNIFPDLLSFEFVTLTGSAFVAARNESHP